MRLNGAVNLAVGNMLTERNWQVFAAVSSDFMALTSFVHHELILEIICTCLVANILKWLICCFRACFASDFSFFSIINGKKEENVCLVECTHSAATVAAAVLFAYDGYHFP